MKKIIAISLVFCMLLAFPAFAVMDNGIRVSISGFSYTGSNGESVSDLALAGSSITASGDLQSIKGVGSQTYSFFIVVSKNGKYYSSDIQSGVLNGAETVPLSVTAELPDDKSGVKVSTYVWDSLLTGNALLPGSDFSASDNELVAIYADGVLLTDIGRNDTEGEITYPASNNHAPRIQAIARDMGAKIEIDPVTTFPQDVKIKVTSGSGEEKIYTLSLKMKEGEISDAYLLDKDGAQHPIKKDVLRLPDYGSGLKPGDEGFDLISAVPVSSTYVFSDRTGLYYYDIPDALLGKTVLQTSMQVLAYDPLHLDKNNAKAVMGGFTINRSANVYVYGVKNTADWIVAEGYVPAPEEFKISRTQNTAAPHVPNVFVKTYTVEEGETVRVNLGNATSSDGNKANYHMLVDFLTPDQVAGIRNVSVDGYDGLDFDSMKTEYDIDLFGNVTEVPEINFEVYGMGATAVYEPATSLPGVSKIKVTSGDGKFEREYKFNIHLFENVLRGIKADGIAIDGFDKYTYDYTFTLPYGDNDVREISVEASDYIDVDIVQATNENKTATITLTDPEGNVAVYTVTFELTLERPTVEKKLACSWTGILNTAFSIDPLINITSPSADHLYKTVTANHSVVATNNSSYKNSILYNRIDLTKLTNRAEGKPVYYNLFTQLGSDQLSGVETNIEMYQVDDGIWSVLNGSDKVAAAEKAADIAGLTASEFIGAVPITQSGGYWTATAGFYQFDITEAVEKALLEGKSYITIGVRLVPVETQTTYVMRLRVWQNSSTQSNVSYYSYE